MAADGAASGGPPCAMAGEVACGTRACGTRACGISVWPGVIAPAPPEGANCWAPGMPERDCCADAGPGINAAIIATAAARSRSRAPFPSTRFIFGLVDWNQGNFKPPLSRQAAAWYALGFTGARHAGCVESLEDPAVGQAGRAGRARPVRRRGGHAADRRVARARPRQAGALAFHRF